MLVWSGGQQIVACAHIALLSANTVMESQVFILWFDTIGVDRDMTWPEWSHARIVEQPG